MISSLSAAYSPAALEALTAARRTLADGLSPAQLLLSPREQWEMILRAGPEAFAALQARGLPGRLFPRLAVPPPLRTADTNRLAYAETSQLWMTTLDQDSLASPETRSQHKPAA